MSGIGMLILGVYVCVVFVTTAFITYRGGIGPGGISAVHLCSAWFWVAWAVVPSNQARKKSSTRTIKHASVQASNSRQADEWHRDAHHGRVCAVFVTTAFLTH